MLRTRRRAALTEVFALTTSDHPTDLLPLAFPARHPLLRAPVPDHDVPALSSRHQRRHLCMGHTRFLPGRSAGWLPGGSELAVAGSAVFMRRVRVDARDSRGRRHERPRRQYCESCSYTLDPPSSSYRQKQNGADRQASFYSSTLSSAASSSLPTTRRPGRSSFIHQRPLQEVRLGRRSCAYRGRDGMSSPTTA